MLVWPGWVVGLRSRNLASQLWLSPAPPFPGWFGLCLGQNQRGSLFGLMTTLMVVFWKVFWVVPGVPDFLSHFTSLLRLVVWTESSVVHIRPRWGHVAGRTVRGGAWNVVLVWLLHNGEAANPHRLAWADWGYRQQHMGQWAWEAALVCSCHVETRCVLVLALFHAATQKESKHTITSEIVSCIHLQVHLIQIEKLPRRGGCKLKGCGLLLEKEVFSVHPHEKRCLVLKRRRVNSCFLEGVGQPGSYLIEEREIADRVR